MSGSFGPLHIRWNVYVELKNDRVQPRSSKKEALDFLQTMVTSQKVDITMVMRNVVYPGKAISKRVRHGLLTHLAFPALEKVPPWPVNRVFLFSTLFISNYLTYSPFILRRYGRVKKQIRQGGLCCP